MLRRSFNGTLVVEVTSRTGWELNSAQMGVCTPAGDAVELGGAAFSLSRTGVLFISLDLDIPSIAARFVVDFVFFGVLGALSLGLLLSRDRSSLGLLSDRSESVLLVLLCSAFTGLAFGSLVAIGISWGWLLLGDVPSVGERL
jgi:hypothetical protein